MSSKKKSLSLVPFEPNKYDVGDVLSREDATIIESSNEINSALSLYFQWEEKHSCYIMFSSKGDEKPLTCEMDYDHDESSPSEIRIILSDPKKMPKAVPGMPVTLRFEIFKVSYEFQTAITAAPFESLINDWHLIVDVPDRLKVLRSRKLPRVHVNDTIRQNLPPCSWNYSTTAGKKSIDLKIIEIGMGSTVCHCSEPLEGSGNLRLGKLEFPARVVRSSKSETVFAYEFLDITLFGQFWDIYRLAAYPSLRSRYEFPYEVGIDLYKETGYFESCHQNKSQDEISAIQETWELIKTGFHKTNSDYYVVDDKDKPTGCSGLALSYYSGEIPIWTYHQLCALKKPELLTRSGDLYLWRAEYLAAYPGNLISIGSFRSKSRWLERIYIRHALTGGKDSKVFPVLIVRRDIPASRTATPFPTRRYLVGEVERVSTTSLDIWGGSNPLFFNANCNLNKIISIAAPYEKEELENLAAHLGEQTGQDPVQTVFVVPQDSDLKLEGKVQASDRYCTIPKNDLLNFISVVDHSISVTIRKGKQDEAG